MLYHNPLCEINASAGSYHSRCLDLMVTVNYSFPSIDLQRAPLPERVDGSGQLTPGLCATDWRVVTGRRLQTGRRLCRLVERRLSCWLRGCDNKESELRSLPLAAVAGVTGPSVDGWWRYLLFHQLE